ncbi:GIY-YIG nuclease family protein [Streptomyces sp. NPDC001939]
MTLSDPVELCDEHKLQSAAAVLPGLLAVAMRDARSTASRTLPLELAHMVASAQAAPMPSTDAHSSLVYFMANGGRVKIGHTKSLFSRISALSLRADAVLLLLHGGVALERALHAKFGAHRVGFELAPDVVHFIATKAPKHRQVDVKRPVRRRKPVPSAAPSRKEQRAVALAVISDLFADLQRRPLESEMVTALRGRDLPHSRQYANKLRGEIEQKEPRLAALGSDNITPLTG